MNLAIALASQTLGFIPTIRKLGFMTHTEHLLYQKIEKLEAELGYEASVVADLRMKLQATTELLNRYYTGSIQFEAV
jgi:hypothetical protein